MNNKMRVGRKHADGSWSGAIGAYLQGTITRAKSLNDGREEGRRTAPGVNTMKNRERILRVLSAIALEKDAEWMHELKPEDWAEAKRRCITEAQADPRVKTELKSGTIASMVHVFRTFARFCSQNGAISTRSLNAILNYLTIPSVEYRRFAIVPGSKWPLMFADASKRHPVEVVVVALGLYLLMRDSELARLQWRHFDFAEKTVTFPRDKIHGSKITVPIADELAAILNAWIAWLKAHFQIDEIPREWHVVTSRLASTYGKGVPMHPNWPVDPTKPMLPETVQRLVKFAGKAAGLTDEQLEGQAVHLLRRSGAEDLYQRGWDIRVISELLGHGSPGKPNIDMTMRYLGHGVDMDKLRAAVNREDPSGNRMLVPSLADISKPKPTSIEVDLDNPEEVLRLIDTPTLLFEIVQRLNPAELLTFVAKVTRHISPERVRWMLELAQDDLRPFSPLALAA